MGWITDSLIDNTIDISKYNPLPGSSCIKLVKELDHPKKGLINIHNINVMNALNDFWLGAYILEVFIQQELERLTNY